MGGLAKIAASSKWKLEPNEFAYAIKIRKAIAAA
jgi:hypothetical protein